MLPALVFSFVWLFGATPGAAAGLQQRTLAALKHSAPFLVIAVAYLALRMAVLGKLSPAETNLPLSTVALTAPSVLWFYLKHLLLPVNLSLFYYTPYVTSLAHPGFWIAAAALLLLAVATWALARRWRQPLIVFAALWLLLTVIPALNFRAFYWRELAHDRYLYLPSVGFVILVGMALRGLRLGKPQWLEAGKAQVVTTLLLAVTLGASTVLQSTQWASALLLYYHAATVAPDNVGAVYLLANELSLRGRIEDAIVLLERATRLAPNWGEAWATLGQKRYAGGHYTEAEADLVRATEMDPKNATAFYVLALDRMQLGRTPEAEAPLRKAIELQPGGAGYHLALGLVLHSMGDRAGAAAEFQKELAYHPDDRQAAALLANVQQK